MAATSSCSTINLKGSVKIVTEFFGKKSCSMMLFCILEISNLNCLVLDYAINNILYQRGIYPSDTVCIGLVENVGF